MNISGAELSIHGVDVLFVCALPEEFTAARDVATNGFLHYPGVERWAEMDENDSTDYQSGRFVVTNNVAFTVALVLLPEMGGDMASRVLGTLVERLDPACLAMSGVCAGRPGEVALGDVIIADPAYHCLMGKKTPEGFRPDIRTFDLDPLWTKAARKLQIEDLDRFRLPTRDESKRWLLRCLSARRDPLTQPDHDRYLRGDIGRAITTELEVDGLIRRNDVGREILTPAGRSAIARYRREYPEGPDALPFQLFVGPMASGPYVDSSDPWDSLSASGVRKVIGYEMEAFSIASAARYLGKRNWIVAKGAMDGATSEKADSFKEFAAYASAEVVWKFLAEQHLLHSERMLRPASPGSAALPEGNLLDPGDEFVGRDLEAQTCHGHVIHGERLVTVIGPPGAGKTRLATEVARKLRSRFDGRVYLVDLSLVSDPDLVFANITSSLKIEADDPLIDALRELFRGIPSLIILDNFDRVTGAAQRVADLHRVAPDLVLLVTSQGPLHLQNERTVDLGALDQADAERLFRARAAARMDGPAASAAVTRLCRLVDGLPLAIELIAPYAALLTPQQMSKVAESEGFIRLQNLMQGATDRFKTVESAIRWSFELLEVEQQNLFIRLAVFDGGWTAAAAEAIADDSPSASRGADLLRLLLDRRLLVVDDPDDAEPRFRMLSPLREFGRGILRERPDLSTGLADRHATYYHDLVCTQQPALTGGDKAWALGVLARDHANIHAGLEHLVSAGEVRAALEMAAALDAYWWSRNYTEGATHLAAVLGLALPDGASTDQQVLRALACFAAGKLALRQFRLADARIHFAEVQSIGLVAEKHDLEAKGLEREALVDIEEGLYADARGKLERALEIDEAQLEDEHAADCLDDLGAVAAEEDDYPLATEYFNRAIARYPKSPDHQAEAWVRIDLAQVSLLRSDTAEARRHARYAWEVGQSNGDHGLLMWSEHLLGLTDVADGDHHSAREQLTQSLQRAMLLGNRRARLRALEGLAVLAASIGKAETALTLAAAMDAARDQSGPPRARTEERLMASARAVIRAQLTSVAWARASDVGGQQTLEQATEFAQGI